MAGALATPKLTAAEYLAWESGQTERHDYVDGEIYAMTGGILRHNVATGAAFATLRGHLKGSPCRAFVNDVKVQVAVANSFFYPDIVVTCSPRDLGNLDSTLITEPILILEVLSPSTAAYDRGEKFARLRQLSSLQEYALLDVQQQRLEVFRRNAQSRWELYPFDASAPVELASISWQGALADLLE